jgi:hypothetical protein
MKIVRLVMTAGLLAVASACDGHLTDSTPAERIQPATQVLISTDTVFTTDSIASDTASIARDGGSYGSGT